MRFKPHFDLIGKHAFMSPSSYAWIRYDEEKMAKSYYTEKAARRGTRLHELAQELIALGVKLPDIRKTFNLYVNDAIGYRMTPEVVLYFSDNCFGTADTLSFRLDHKTDRYILRIHDLKTGLTRTSENQLEIYAVIFCLEYGIDMSTIDIELRIYKGDDFVAYIPDLDDLLIIRDRIITYDNIIEDIKREETGD
jgi:hypothetical protein